MFHSSSNPANLYSEVSVDTGVNSADPHRLIELLFEKAEEHLLIAENAISRGDLTTKGQSITRVIRIVDEGLKASLNYDGGELAVNLGRLYDYILQRLLHANQNDSASTLVEVRGLLLQIHTAWSAIAPGVSENSVSGASA